MVTLEYTITYRMPGDKIQSEMKRYTKVAADVLAAGIIEMGGVAIVSEDVTEIDPDEMQEGDGPIVNDKRTLNWEKEN